MGKGTAISWATDTFNPWWGCQRVSPGCENCYAERDAARYGHAVWGPASTPRRFFGEKHWNEPLKWNREAIAAGVRRRVFCASMADVFEARADLDPWRARLWLLIEATPALDWLLLTKRPENIERMLPPGWRSAPRPNVWLGTTVESREYLWRIDELCSVAAAVRWLSVEPQLGPVELARYLEPTVIVGGGAGYPHTERPGPPAIHWVITGGESGGRYTVRPYSVEWARRIVQDCRRAGVAVFVKQLGSHAIDPERSGTRRLPLLQSKGDDPTEWPADLRVQEFPRVDRIGV